MARRAETHDGGPLFWTVLLIVTGVAVVNGSIWYFGRNRFSDYRINRLRTATMGCMAWVALDIAHLLPVPARRHRVTGRRPIIRSALGIPRHAASRRQRDNDGNGRKHPGQIPRQSARPSDLERPQDHVAHTENSCVYDGETPA